MKNNLSNFLRSSPFYNILFLIIVLGSCLTFIFLTVQGRIGGYDYLSIVFVKYFIFNNTIIAHEIPQWIPYLVHGAPTAYFNALCGERLLDFLLLIAAFLMWFIKLIERGEIIFPI